MLDLATLLQSQRLQPAAPGNQQEEQAADDRIEDISQFLQTLREYIVEQIDTDVDAGQMRCRQGKSKQHGGPERNQFLSTQNRITEETSDNIRAGQYHHPHQVLR